MGLEPNTWWQVRDDLAGGESTTGCKRFEDRPLKLRQILAHASRRDVSSGEEPHRDRPGALLDLRSRQASLRHEVDHVLDATTPLLDDATEVEHVCHAWVPGTRLVWPEQQRISINAFGVFLMRQPQLVVQNEGMNTTRLHVAAFTEEEHSNERAMLALPAIASLPMLILFVSLSRYFLRGANLFSATKG